MPLHVADPPLEAYEAVRATLADLAEKDGFRTPVLRRADPAAIALSTPHRFAVLPLDRIRRAELSVAAFRDAAAAKGWRFLLHDGKRVVAAIDALEDPNGRHRFGQVNEGPFTAATEVAIRRAERLDIVQKGRYAPAFLLVPALYVAALWLQDQDGDADLVMPMAPAPPELTPWEPLEAGAFLGLLARLAERVPKDDPKAKDPSGG